MHSPDELSPAALRMRESIERRLFGPRPPPSRRLAAISWVVALALALLACALTLAA